MLVETLTSPAHIDNNLCMLGRINTLQKCPVCRGKFSALDQAGLYCPGHLTRPTRYYVYFMTLLYSTPQGNVLDSYERAKRLLSSIQTAYDDAKKHPETKRFDINDWIPKKVKHFRFSIKADEILKEYDAKYERKKISKSRIQAVYNFTNKFLKPFFKDRDIRDIISEDITGLYYLLLDRQYSDAHIKDLLAYLKYIISRVRRDDMPDFPSFEIEPKKEKQRLQIERQMAIAPFISDRHGYRLAINILQTTGMRPCEVRPLQVNDIVENGILSWKSLTDRLKLKRKSGGEQFHPLPDYIMADLREHIKGKTPDNFIFEIDGKPFGEGRLRKVWNKAIKDCNIARVKEGLQPVKHIEFNQACRHSWASREMKQAKESAIERIQERLGHTNKQTQKHYIIER